MPAQIATPSAPPLSSEYLTEDDLSKFLKRSKRQLRRYFEQRIGPPRVVFGRVVLYRRSAVEAWLASHEVAPRPKNRRAAR